MVTIAITGMAAGYVPAVVALSIACLVWPNKGLKALGRAASASCAPRRCDPEPRSWPWEKSHHCCCHGADLRVHAHRPFDGTDAAVADKGQLEIEPGPAEYL